VRGARRVAVAVLVIAGSTVGCARYDRAVPRCSPGERLGLVAQSVPDAAYLPCVTDLLPGWSISAFEVRDGHTSFSLRSDRADEPVEVELSAECETTGSTPVPPRDEGVRTSQRVSTVSPTYAGTMFDVFPGGCVAYGFDFERGPHIALVDELRQIVALYPRRELRQELIDRLEVDIGA
jgi:hypothetical protein